MPTNNKQGDAPIIERRIRIFDLTAPLNTHDYNRWSYFMLLPSLSIVTNKKEWHIYATWLKWLIDIRISNQTNQQ